MADETVVAQSDVTEQVKANSEESQTAVAKPAGDVDPQETQEQGEQDLDGKRRSGWQRQKEKLDRLEQQNDFLMRELLKRTSAPEEKAAPSQQSAEPEDPEPDESTFDTVKGYINALTDWKVRNALKAQEAKSVEAKKAETAKSEEQKEIESWNKQIAAAHEKYDDMEDALQAQIPVSNAMKRELMRSEFAGDLAHFLGTNPEVAKQVYALGENPAAVARAFGRIEAQFASQESAEKKEEVKPDPPPVTKAPKPPTPVSKSSPSAPTKPEEARDFKEFVKLRNAQLTRK